MKPPALLLLAAVLPAAVLPAARPGAARAEDLPPAYTVSPQVVLQVNHYTEGVVFDREGNLFFSQTKPGLVTRLTPAGQVSEWARVPGANGHRVLADGTHLVCAERAVAVLDAMGKPLRAITADAAGRPFVYPNDLAVDPRTGGWYLTDSGHLDPVNDGALFYCEPGADVRPRRLEEGMRFVNGVALSPDGRRLYVDEGNANSNHVLVYDVEAPGRLANKRLFADLPRAGEGQIENKPDGMAVDAAGNLYVSHWGMGRVEVLSPEGRLLRSYPTGHLTQSNVAFGGPRLDQLYLTGGDVLESGVGSVHRLDLGVPGLPLLAPAQP